MPHVFEKQGIDRYKGYAREKCYYCDIESLRYPDARPRKYVLPDGTITYIEPTCKERNGKMNRVATEPKTEEQKQREIISNITGIDINETPKRHKFSVSTIPEGQTSVKDRCPCGLEVMRYNTGSSIRYINADGSLSNIAPYQCTVMHEPATDKVKQVKISKNKHSGHKFLIRDFPEGSNFVEETCEQCGLKRMRYRRGAPKYFLAGKYRSTMPYDCGKRPTQETAIPVPKPKYEPVLPERQELAKPVVHEPISNDKPLVEQLTQKLERNIGMHRLMDDITKMPDIEARLTEALVIIRTLYEDAVKAGINTTGRWMAGRFLYSQDYIELVKTLDAAHAAKLAPPQQYDGRRKQ